jgi:anthranilate synthase/aminodeoxychorismate synthase-like glutamine amidotransferase
LQPGDFAALLISPGPCGPAESGHCLKLVQAWFDRIPMLGVCLGHQIIAEAAGSKIIRAASPVHGKSCPVVHDGKSPLFKDIPSPFVAGRYHSLTVVPSSLPTSFRAIASSEDGVVMAMQHITQPVYGVQFHPESVLTECGYQLLHNFLSIAGLQPAGPDNLRIFA